MNAWNIPQAFMLRVIALALDAAVDHAEVQLTETQYEELLLDARRRLYANAGESAPAYPEALIRVAVSQEGRR